MLARILKYCVHSAVNPATAPLLVLNIRPNY